MKCICSRYTTSIGFRMKLIQDYIYYNFISHAALRVKMIARLKSPNFIRTKERHRITYVLVS